MGRRHRCGVSEWLRPRQQRPDVADCRPGRWQCQRGAFRVPDSTQHGGRVECRLHRGGTCDGVWAERRVHCAQCLERGGAQRMRGEQVGVRLGSTSADSARAGGESHGKSERGSSDRQRDFGSFCCFGMDQHGRWAQRRCDRVGQCVRSWFRHGDRYDEHGCSGWRDRVRGDSVGVRLVDPLPDSTGRRRKQAGLGYRRGSGWERHWRAFRRHGGIGECGRGMAGQHRSDGLDERDGARAGARSVRRQRVRAGWGLGL